MADPRNVAHDKKVSQEKHHEQASHSGAGSKRNEETAPANSAPTVEPAPGEAEKSVAVLSKLKDLEFHSRANIEALAGLTLTIEDELKQKEFSEAIGEVYSAQDAFQTKILALIENYSIKVEELRHPG